MFSKVFIGILVFLCWYNIVSVRSHAKLESPKARYGSWQNCGGYNTQKNIWNGQCGICGMEFGASVRRRLGGKGIEGSAKVEATWTAGQTVEVVVTVSAHHKGYFQFSICPRDNEQFYPFERCFQRHIVELADGSGTKYDITNDRSDRHKIALKVPSDVCCSNCLFRWHYHTGNSRGTENGIVGEGLGHQENFMACANVKIVDCDDCDSQPATTAVWRETPLTTRKIVHCVAARGQYESDGQDAWCKANCKDYVISTDCPASHCCCGESCDRYEPK